MLDGVIADQPDARHPAVHSDRGYHYRRPGWIKRMKKASLIRSMSRKGCSSDNAARKGFFSPLKNEMFYRRSRSGVSPDYFDLELDDCFSGIR